MTAPETTCWYTTESHRPESDTFPRDCNGAPVASERMPDRSQHLYCEAHWYWRHRDVPAALLTRL